MARETKAQRQEKQRQREFEQWNQFWLTYPDRLAQLIWGYACEFTEKNGLTVDRVIDENDIWFVFCDISVDSVWTLPINLQRETDLLLEGKPVNNVLITHLEGAESALWRARARRDEELRKQQVRVAALAKLSEEERLLLGIVPK